MKRILSFVVFVCLISSFARVSAQDFLESNVSAFRLQSRFIGGIDFSVAPSFTRDGSNLTSTRFDFKAGYKVNSTYLSGIFGIEYLNGENFLPLGIEIKQSFTQKTWAPFIYAQTGYSMHLKRNINSRYNTANYAQYDPSFFTKIGIGYSFVSSLSEFSFSIAYHYHQLEEIMVEQTGEIRTDLTMNGLSVTVGFIF